MPEYTVISDGTPVGTTVYADGSPLRGIKGLSLFAQANDAVELCLEVQVVKLEFIGREARFEGLEEVPTEALEQELNRRREQDAYHPE